VTESAFAEGERGCLISFPERDERSGAVGVGGTIRRQDLEYVLGDLTRGVWVAGAVEREVQVDDGDGPFEEEAVAFGESEEVDEGLASFAPSA
jgi:hypothetical protein